MKQVSSPSIKAIGYDPKTRKLSIHWKSNDAIYVYHNIDEKLYQMLMNSDKKRTFIEQHLHNRYKHTKS